MPERREKILAIAFKYLGDVVVAIPALRALRAARPDAELHVLVAEDALPIVNTLPWIDRAWALPRTRGKARLRDSLPVIRALRREKFDTSLDFIGNDRGAFLSLSIGAKKRYGLDAPRGFFGRRWCYHVPVAEAPTTWHESRRHLHFLAPIGVDQNASLDLEIRADPALAQAAAKILPEPAIIAHLTTSKPLKEWPLTHWKALIGAGQREGLCFVLAAGPSAREREIRAKLAAQLPGTPVLPETKTLAEYLAVLARAQMLVSGDTGPMHFAAGLGVPTLSMFGPSDPNQWAPLGPKARIIRTSNCRCSHNEERCVQADSCWNHLTPETVLAEIRALLSAK